MVVNQGVAGGERAGILPSHRANRTALPALADLALTGILEFIKRYTSSP
jgi:hypothetical protein